MMTTGEGGMVVSDNQRLIDRVKDLREYDHKPSYRMCFNYKMTDIQAAVGIVQLSQLPVWIEKRKAVAARYSERLAGCGLSLPVPAEGQDHIFFRYVVKIKRRKDDFIQMMKSKGVDCAAPVFKPLHQYLKRTDCPVAQRLARESVSIPIYPSLTPRDVEYVIRQVTSCLKDGTSVFRHW
jgi:perosamine synthetase